MQRVIGLGGPFIKAANPQELAKWYEKHLGIPFGNNIFADLPQNTSNINVLSFFTLDNNYFNPSLKQVMLNFIVADVFGLIAVLREEGVTIIDEPIDTEYGKFGWILDPEDNKIELWEPVKNK